LISVAGPCNGTRISIGGSTKLPPGHRPVLPGKPPRAVYDEHSIARASDAAGRLSPADTKLTFQNLEVHHLLVPTRERQRPGL